VALSSPSHIVVRQAEVNRILAGTFKEARLAYRDEGEVATVLDQPGDEFRVIHIDEIDQLGHSVAEAIGANTGTTVVCAVIGDTIRCFVPGNGIGQPLSITVLPDKADVFDRVRGIFETAVLAGRSVAVLGLGSGGSFILRELIKCGVSRFLLIDHDRLEVGNICRHECGLSDVGRLKVNAMRDYVLDRNPSADITTLKMHIDSNTQEEFSTTLQAFKPDIVVCATDNRTSRLLINRICVQAGLPAIYAGVFRRAYGGQVLRVIPGLTPCYQCFVSALPTMASDHEISTEDAATRIAYSDLAVAIEPGLASDIAPIALLVAKLALMELLAGTSSTLEPLNDDLVAPLYLWLNRREQETEYASWHPMATGIDELSILRWYGIGLSRNEECPACGSMPLEGISPDADLDVSAFQHPSAS
jgi:molybdopterin/thiamine biosynthesis adenylyltransferase